MMWISSRIQVGALLCLLANCSLGEAQASDQNPILYGGNNTNGCDEACTSLVNILGEKVHYQDLPSSLFKEYFSARQSEVRPTCLAIPTSAEDVSEIVKVISQHSCKFAAKSGGHSMFAGAASAPGGITIDLKLLDELSLSEDRETVFVGTGNRWSAVYGFLDPWNLTAVGGRAGFVGVGGFLLGGGLSYVSRKYGWGADNVRNFEVVLANGSISSINYSTHPDLYWALRGGGSNFGIVTRFDLETHPQGPAWGDFSGMFVSDVTSRAAELGVSRTPTTTYGLIRLKAISSLIRFGCIFGYCTDLNTYSEMLWRTLEGSADDPYLQVYGFLCLLPWGDITGFHMINGKGVEDVPGYREVKKGRKVVSKPRTAAMSWFADDLSRISGNGGQRSSFSALSLKNPSVEMIKKLHDIFLEEVASLQAMDGVVASLPLMFITKDEVLHMSKNGGNPLGLEIEDCPLLLVDAAFTWPSADLDDLVLGASKRFIDRATAMGKETGTHHRYLYMNYASQNQDVFAGYGEKNRKKLREIQKKYDSDDVFHRLLAGPFKV